LAVINPAYTKEELEFALGTVSMFPRGCGIDVRNEDIHHDAKVEYTISYPHITTPRPVDVPVLSIPDITLS